MRRIPLITTLVLISSTAWAASFDCARASKSMEKQICADPKLFDLDVQMAALYQALSKSVSGRELARLKDDQRAWLRDRDASKDSKSLRASYRARIVALKAKQAALARAPDWQLGEFVDAHAIQMYGENGWRQDYASDSYLLRKVDAKTLSFEFALTGNNAHECSGSGHVTREAPDAQVWTGTTDDDDAASDAPAGEKPVCKVRISFLKDRVKIAASGDGCDADCGAGMSLGDEELFPIEKNQSAADLAHSKE